MGSRRPRVLAVVLGCALIAGLLVAKRVTRVTGGASVIPTYQDAADGGVRVRYWPRLLSWDDRSDARVDRLFAFRQATSLLAVARAADEALAARGWYLVTPDDLGPLTSDPQVVVWQHDPDERLDLTQLWPIAGMSRTERLYGGAFPPSFLEAPQVISWSWALGGPRSVRPVSNRGPRVLQTPPPGRSGH